MITLRFCVVDLVSAHTTTLLDSFFASLLPTTGVYTFQSGGRLVAWKLLIQCQDTVIIIFTVSKHVTLLIFYKNFMLM